MKKKTIPVVVSLFVVFLLILAIGVVVLIMVPVKSYFLPESPERVALRRSPANAFYAVERATAIMNSVTEPEEIVQVLEKGWPTSHEEEGIVFI